MKKKHIRWALWTIASPFILFLILCILIYLPPIQTFLVDKAAVYASRASGMNITVGHISLSFPLRLVMSDVDAVSPQNDTVFSVQRLQVNVQLLPLLKKQVEVDGIALQGASVNSGDLIEGMRLSGTLGEFFLSSHGVALDPETAIVNKVLLKDTDLSLCLNDTTAADTTATDTLYWKIILQEMDLQNVAFSLQMPSDTMTVSVALDEALLRNGLVDLHKSAYSLQTFRIKNGRLKYDGSALPADSVSGLDPSHLSLTNIGVQLDSLQYEGRNMRAIINQLMLKEQSGLEIASTEGSLLSDEKTLRIPSLRMATPDSYMELNVAAGWDALDMKANGKISARLMADIGKPDVIRFMGKMDEDFVRRYPSEPIRIRTGIDGDLNRLKLTALTAEWHGALELLAKGELTYLTDSLQRGGEITLEAATKNLDFISALAEGVHIPHGTRLAGKFTMAGPEMGTDVLLMQPKAHAVAQIDTIPITVYNDDTLSVADDFKMENAIRVYARYDMSRESYEAQLAVNQFDLHRFMPADSLYLLSARLKVEGEGTDFLAPQTYLKAEGGIDRLHYGSYDLSGISLSAGLERQKAVASLAVQNRAMDVDARVDGIFKPNDVAGNLNIDIRSLDWQALRLMDIHFLTSQHIGVRFSSDLRQRYAVDAEMTDATVTTAKRTFHPKNLFAGFSTSADSTHAYLRAGDLDVALEGKGHIDHISRQAGLLMTKMTEQWTSKSIEQDKLREYLPGLCLKVSSGPDNPIANYMSVLGMNYSRLFMDVDASPVEGLNGEAYLYGLRNDSLLLDTVYLDIRQDMEGINIRSGVASGPKPKQEAFEVELTGNVGNKNAQVLLQYFNARKEQGVYLGLTADLRRHGIRMKIFPEQPTLIYRPFTVNKNNFIYLSDRGRIYANVMLHDSRGTGLSFYTNREDTVAAQEMTVELSRINLKEFRRIMPYLPDMEGWIGAEAHYVDSGSSMMLSSDLQLEDFRYEGNPLGNWEFGGVYLPGEQKDHHLDAYLRHDGEEIAHLGGLYLPTDDGAGSLNAEVSLEHFPLNVANPFIPDHMVELLGRLDGALTVKGNPVKPILDGELALDSVTFFMPEMSAAFRLDNEPVQVTGSRMMFKNFDIFTKGTTPFIINGNVDFSNLERVTADLKMKASNYELINAPRTRQALVYGKMYVDFDATLRGPLEELVMRGNMNVLGKTNFTYVLKDSPLAVNDRLGDMVTFVNFNDTTTVVEDNVQTISLGGMDMAMTMHIDPAVQARVDLVPDGSNYMLLEGGGDLSFQYTPQGDMLLTGRYSLISGEMKYEIPIIPLKTFSIQNGSYVEWTGNIMNPQLSITATERVRASVGESGQASRMVGFDVGIALNQRLENLGLAFTLSAPEDATVQDQLNAMSAEERGKLAITMLVTGVYMAEGNSAGGAFNVNNALNSFLQSEISNIAGKALDINVGMETVDDADGSGKRTDYNFQFAKRFWNNRFRIVIGGKVSTGSTVQQDETFIDNVSVEYRLDNSGTRYVKLFHDKNYESVLEGEITETGVGIVLRKKMSRLGELFIFRNRKKNANEEVTEQE